MGVCGKGFWTEIATSSKELHQPGLRKRARSLQLREPGTTCIKKSTVSNPTYSITTKSMTGILVENLIDLSFPR